MVAVEVLREGDLLERREGVFIDDAVGVMVRVFAAFHSEIDMLPVGSRTLRNSVGALLGNRPDKGRLQGELPSRLQEAGYELRVGVLLCLRIVPGKFQGAVVAIFRIGKTRLRECLHCQDRPRLVRACYDELLADDLDHIAAGDVAQGLYRLRTRLAGTEYDLKVRCVARCRLGVQGSSRSLLDGNREQPEVRPQRARSTDGVAGLAALHESDIAFMPAALRSVGGF